MATKAQPWRTLRNFAVRSRPIRPPACPTCLFERRATTTKITAVSSSSSPPSSSPFSTTSRRGLADHTSTRQSSSAYNDNDDDALNAASNTYKPTPHYETFAPNFLNAEALAALEKAAEGQDLLDLEDEGLKFAMPPRPTKNERLHDRYHPVVDQVTKLLMRDGKLSQAQKHMTLILSYLRTSPPPKVNPLRPLLPGSPPASHLPLNPLLYLTLAIDSVAPVIRVKSMKGMAGGGAALDLPEPLAARARRRQAVVWILDAVDRKKSTGSGRAQFAHRFGQEIVAVVEGRSSVWDRRQLVHRLGTAARANLSHPKVVGKVKRRMN